MPLFTAKQLSDFVHDDVAIDEAAQAEDVAWGWLAPVLGLEEKPEQAGVQLRSWILELGAIAYDNPTGLEAHQLGAERRQFSQERRREILAEAGATVGGGSGPLGSFPEPLPDLCW